MQISETTFTVSDSGSLKIPAAVIKEMGLSPGDHIRIAYLSRDGHRNIFREFLLSADPLDVLSEDDKIKIPSHLLNQAHIPDNADLQILCLSGCLLICPDSTLNTNELSSVFESLQIAGDIAASLPIDLSLVRNQLQELNDCFEKGVPEDEES